MVRTLVFTLSEAGAMESSEPKEGEDLTSVLTAPL